MLRMLHLIHSPPIVNRDFFEGQWQNLNDNLFSQAPDLFPQKSFSYERFLWAVATLRAHVHAPLQGTRVALVPLADLVSTPCLCVSRCLAAFQAMLLAYCSPDLVTGSTQCDCEPTLLLCPKHSMTQLPICVMLCSSESAPPCATHRFLVEMCMP